MADARTSQVVLEIWDEPTSESRVTQTVVEIWELDSADTLPRVSQTVLEIFESDPAPPPNFVRLTQQGRYVLTTEANPPVRLTQMARTVLYPFTCVPIAPPPEILNCPDQADLSMSAGPETDCPDQPDQTESAGALEDCADQAEMGLSGDWEL